MQMYKEAWNVTVNDLHEMLEIYIKIIIKGSGILAWTSDKRTECCLKTRKRGVYWLNN